MIQLNLNTQAAIKQREGLSATHKTAGHFVSDRQSNVMAANEIPLDVYKGLLFRAKTGKIAFGSSNFKKDNNYRAVLAREIGCDPASLKSIVGINELTKDILPKLKYENYSTGKNFENVKNGTFKASLHMHTLHSDGNLTPKEMLDQAARYADRIKEPFYLAISDHDVLEGAREAIRIIASEPEKYKNVRLIPGVEFCARYDNPEFFNKTAGLEVMGYCINPFDKDITKFLDNNARENFRFGQKLLDKINDSLNLEGDERITIEQARRYALIRDGGSPGFTPAMKYYVIDRLSGKFDDEVLLDNALNRSGLSCEQATEKINEIFDNYYDQYGGLNNIFGITPNTPTMEQLHRIVKKSGFGALGIAHPGWIGLKHSKASSNEEAQTTIKQLFKDAQKAGITAAEVNYQYGQEYFGNNPKMALDWLESIKTISQETGFARTGGLDTHSNCIFTVKEWLKDDRVESLLTGK